MSQAIQTWQLHAITLEQKVEFQVRVIVQIIKPFGFHPLFVSNAVKLEPMERQLHSADQP